MGDSNVTSSQTNAFKGTKPFSGTNANHFDNRCKKARSTLTTYRLDTVQALEGTTQADENHRHIGGNSCTARIPRHSRFWWLPFRLLCGYYFTFTDGLYSLPTPTSCFIFLNEKALGEFRLYSHVGQKERLSGRRTVRHARDFEVEGILPRPGV